MAEKVGSVYIEIQAKMGSLEKDLKQLEGRLKQTDQQGQKTGASMASMGKMIASAGITGAVIGLGTAALKASAQMEQNRVAFTTMLGSADKANKLLQQMTAFAASTPFQLPEIVNAGKQLLAFGIESEKIIPTLTRIGDVSAALNIPIGELSDLYGKARVQGTLYAEDLNQLAGRGIPIFTELAKVMGVNADQVKKLGSQGKITFDMMETAFVNMTKEGSQFGGLMDAQSKTLAGQWSNFNDQIDKTLTMLGDEMSPTFKAILTTMNGILDSANQQAAEQKRLRDIEVERLKTNGDIGTAYLLQNGLIATGLNLLNGSLGNELKINTIKQEQQKIETVLTAHRNGTITLSKEALTILEANTAELERQDKILKGTNEGWTKQTGAYKTLNNFLANVNKENEKAESKKSSSPSGKNAEFKKAYDERLRYFENLLKEQERKIEEYGSVEMANFIADLDKKAQLYSQYTGVLTNMSGSLAQLSQMNAQNQTAEVDNRMQKELEAIENRYNTERELIENSTLTEEEKNIKLKALDEARSRDEKAAQDKAAKEKRKIAHEAAKQQKMLAMFDTIIATPTAAFQAFKALAGIPVVGPALGAAAAAATTALGLAKLKLIADQPLPALAQGGIVPAVPGGNQFTIGEAGSAEAVIPLNDQTLGRLAGMINSAGGGGQSYVKLPPMSETAVFNMIFEASKNGDLYIAERAVVTR